MKPTTPGTAAKPAIAAYKKFLIKKHQFAGLVHCPSQKSLAEALQQARKVEDRYVAHRKVIETGWKYQ